MYKRTFDAIEGPESETQRSFSMTVKNGQNFLHIQSSQPITNEQINHSVGFALTPHEVFANAIKLFSPVQHVSWTDFQTVVKGMYSTFQMSPTAIQTFTRLLTERNASIAPQIMPPPFSVSSSPFHASPPPVVPPTERFVRLSSPPIVPEQPPRPSVERVPPPPEVTAPPMHMVATNAPPPVQNNNFLAALLQAVANGTITMNVPMSVPVFAAPRTADFESFAWVINKKNMITGLLNHPGDANFARANEFKRTNYTHIMWDMLNRIDETYDEKPRPPKPSEADNLFWCFERNRWGTVTLADHPRVTQVEVGKFKIEVPDIIYLV